MTTREKILALLQQETSVLSGEKLPKIGHITDCRLESD